MIRFEDWTLHGVWGSPPRFRGPAEGVVVHHSVTNAGSDAKAAARIVEHVILLVVANNRLLPAVRYPESVNRIARIAGQSAASTGIRWAARWLIPVKPTVLVPIHPIGLIGIGLDIIPLGCRLADKSGSTVDKIAGRLGIGCQLSDAQVIECL